MSDSPQKHESKLEEVVPLNITHGQGLGDTDNNNSLKQVISSRVEQCAASCCHDDNHRKLAISSIICGISCIGIIALINSVKAEESTDPERAAKFSQRAKKCGIISIVTWIAVLVSIPILMALVSYLLTLKD